MGQSPPLVAIAYVSAATDFADIMAMSIKEKHN